MKKTKSEQTSADAEGDSSPTMRVKMSPEMKRGFRVFISERPRGTVQIMGLKS